MENIKNIVFQKDKRKGQGVVTGLIMGVVALVISVIIGLVIVQTLNDATLLTSASAEDHAVGNLTTNLTAGIGRVAEKIPTILKIAAVVLLLGVLVLLVLQARRMGFFGAGGGAGSL